MASVVGWLGILVVCGAIATALALLSLLATNPVTVGPAGVTTWFVVLFVALSCIATLALYFAKTFLRVHPTRANRLRYSWRQGLLVSGWATCLIALSSLRQLGVWDGILLGLLLLIVEGYVRLRWP